MSEATVLELHPESSADVWKGLPPGPELGARLASVDLAGLCDAELLVVMAAWRRQATWASAGELAAVAELANRRAAENPNPRDLVQAGEFVADEVCLALRLTGRAAGTLLSLACALSDRLPITRAMLKAGRIDVPRAKVLAEGLLGVSGEAAARVERVIFPQAEAMTTGRLRHRVRQAIIAVDPDAAGERRQRAVKGRHLALSHTPSGTCDLAGYDLPADEADAAYQRINAAAQAMKNDGDLRPVDAIRADLFTALLRGVALPDAAADLNLPVLPSWLAAPPDDGSSNPAGPKPREHTSTEACTCARGVSAGGGRFDLKPADACVRVSDRDAVAALTGEVAALIAGLLNTHLSAATRGKGKGAAPAATTTAHSLAHNLADLKHRWCQAINGPVPNTSGGHGHDGYRPPAAMRRLVIQDYGRCAFPTCRRDATRCDLDHTQAWEKNGPTCWCNLAPLCRHHHRLKQQPDWTLLQLWPGVLVWITPAGHWHLVTPTDRE